MTKAQRTELLTYVFVWGFLIVAWNFGYQTASPLEDCIAAVAILFINRFALKKFKGK